MAFHNATKYYALSDTEPSDDRIGIGDPADRTAAIWQKDWDIKPLLYKVYDSLPPIELPRDLPDTGRAHAAAIAATGAAVASSVVPDKALIGRLGLLTNGSLDRTLTTPDGRTHHYRTAGGTGALYHLELYFVCGDLADLPAGVYHYSAIDHTLRRVRAGDFRAALAAATGQEPSVAAAPVVLAVTSTFWRNAWRYRERAYRHTFWDAGTSLSHILAVAASAQVAATLVFGFADALVNALLDVEGTRESTVALVALGRASIEPPPAPPVERLDLPTRPLSSAEVTWHALTAMHLASGLPTGADAARWRSQRWHPTGPDPTGPLTELRPAAGRPAGRAPTGADHLPAPLDAEVRHRRGDPVRRVLDAARPLHARRRLRRARPGRPAHRPLPDRQRRRGPGARASTCTTRGSARSSSSARAPSAPRPAASRPTSSYPGDAHVNLYYLAHLPSILDRFGDRGYRLAQLEGALHAGKLHLGTHALGLGAVGSTAYDDEVIEFFSPHAAGKDYGFVTVFGKRRSGDRATSRTTRGR